MSPSREMITTNTTMPQQQQQQQRFVPQGINKDSHMIRKPNLHFTSPNPNMSSNNTKINGIVNGNNNTIPTQQKQPQQRRQPVIIYTHSPTILHVTPDGFKDLVQRLTGMPRPEEENQTGGTDSKSTPSTSQTGALHQGEKIVNQTAVVGERDHDYYPPVNNGMIHPPPVVNPAVFDRPPHELPPLPPQMTFLPDPTLYAPNSSDFFRMPSVYGYPSDVFAPTNMTVGDGSSEIIDQMKNFQEY